MCSNMYFNNHRKVFFLLSLNLLLTSNRMDRISSLMDSVIASSETILDLTA